MGEFGVGDFISPGTQVVSIEDPKVYFNLLVDMFCFAIRLGVVGGGEEKVVVEDFTELLSEGRGKLWTMIRDDFLVKPKVEVDLVEKEGSYSLSGDGFLDGAENYPLCKAMVNHNQQRVKARGDRKVSDEVTRDLLEGVRYMRLDLGERGNGGVCAQLILLAGGTAFNVFIHKLGETWPPKLRSNELVSLEIAGMTGGFMVVAVGKDGVVEGIVRRDIGMSFVAEDMIVVLPIQEARLEGSRYIFQGQL